jgi:hypothetical protein
MTEPTASPPTAWDFLVRKADLRDHAVRPADPGVLDAPLADGELILRVEAIALTSNTLTYAVTGDLLGYWQFYPAADGWGRVPAWGYAIVERSAHPEIAVGDRVFGYVPMSSHTRMLASRVRTDSLVDATPHRQRLPAAYNFYRRTGTAATPLTDDDALFAVLSPLFFTSFLIDDQIAERGWDAAGTLVLSSASSKTAFGTAFLLHDRRPAARIVGLTSPRNRGFVESLAIYDAIIDYADLARFAAAAAAPVSFLDFAGNAPFAAALAHQLGPRLTTTLRIGATHWNDLSTGASPRPASSPRPEAFFAPDRIAQRTQLWSAAGLQSRFLAAWTRFLPFARRTLRVDISTGPDALAAHFATIAAGELAADVACVVRP